MEDWDPTAEKKGGGLGEILLLGVLIFGIILGLKSLFSDSDLAAQATALAAMAHESTLQFQTLAVLMGFFVVSLFLAVILGMIVFAFLKWLGSAS